MSSQVNPVLVAVIDSGWNREQAHPRVRSGVSFVDPDDELSALRSDDDDDRNGHGTTCAMLVMEAAPTANILPLRVFGRRLEASISQLRMAIGAAVDERSDIISMSLSTMQENGIEGLYAACEAARKAGVIVVAASYRARRCGYPAVFDNVIGVRAGHMLGEWSWFYRDDFAIDCAAWGLRGAPPSTPAGHAHHPVGTSSVATARIAGILAHFRAEHPGASLAEAREFLARNAARTNRPRTFSQSQVTPAPQ